MDVKVNSEDWVDSGAPDGARVFFQGPTGSAYSFEHSQAKPPHDVRSIVVSGDDVFDIQTMTGYKLWFKADGSGKEIVCGVVQAGS